MSYETLALTPFRAHNFKVTVGKQEPITNNVIKMITVFQEGIARLEIHVRDSQSATLPEIMFGLTGVGAVSDIRLEQLNLQGRTLRETLFGCCTIDDITHHNVDYGSMDPCVWIIKAHTRVVVSTGDIT